MPRSPNGPERSVSYIYNIFINDLLLWITNSKLLNFADDNTIWAAENTNEELINTLEKESQAAIAWLKSNEMIVKGTIVERNNKTKDSRPLNIYQEVINSERCVKLLGFEIDHKISFERLISN